MICFPVGGLFGLARRDHSGGGRAVDEHVRAAVVRLDEAKALGGVEPLHGAGSHVSISVIRRVTRAEMMREIKMSERFLVGPELNPKIKRGEQPKPRRSSMREY